MTASYTRQLTFWGLLLSLVGVLVLFRYGMPFHVPTDGVTYLATEAVNKADIALEHRYLLLGYAGLGCLVVGTILQMLALLPPRTH